MPDPNKHAALADSGFKIQPTCSTCVHWCPQSIAPECRWGGCALKPYHHAKHSEEKKVGTPSIGWCPDYGQDLRSVCFEVGDDYAARYAVSGQAGDLDGEPLPFQLLVTKCTRIYSGLPPEDRELSMAMLKAFSSTVRELREQLADG
ncbi:hypothetical protein LCGC14_0274260 [marine sediment metagenome]|uniref:Uncharacterized protein n=2 Tax=root TaxID=1 RepID=A0A9C9TGG9_9HYPH|nr:hypothetical protein [Aurantimonas coralicida]